MAEQIVCMAEVPSFAASKGSVDLQAVHAAVTGLVKAGYTHIIVAGFGGEYENLTCSDRLDLIACCRGVKHRLHIHRFLTECICQG